MVITKLYEHLSYKTRLSIGLIYARDMMWPNYTRICVLDDLTWIKKRRLGLNLRP